jgi:hypothetical protein
MKKSLLAILLVGVFMLSACQKNVEVVEEPEKPVVEEVEKENIEEKEEKEETYATAYDAIIAANFNVYKIVAEKGTVDEEKEGMPENISDFENEALSRIGYALEDVNNDGIEELILSYDSFIILLHLENDKVYGTDFHLSSMETIYTDGSFSWSHTDDIFGYECGISRISFANGIKKVEELCRAEGNSKFFIGGIQVTKKQYNDYLNKSERTPIAFTAFDITAFDTNNEWKAIKLASEYWGIKDGDFDPRGLRYRIICKRKIDERWYEVSLYRFVYNRYYEHLEIATVNIETKEIKITKYPDGKG